MINELLNECLGCTKPTCINGCPAKNNIKEYIKLLKEGKLDEALEVIKLTSTLPSICSTVCPYNKQCEGSCIKNKMGKPVKIHEIENYIALNAKENIPEIINNNYKVALIGSGPSSLACAEKLRLKGYKCDIYDKYDVPGGILTYGIPDFVLDKKVVSKKIDYLKQIGINFYMNKEYPEDISLEYLKKEYDAIFIGVGAPKPKYMNIDGEDKDGIVDANLFLERMYKNDYTLFDKRTIRNIIVVGGGNTAIDCARVAKRKFDAEVTIVYRRTLNEMPARYDEYEKALSDSISFSFLTNPLAYLGDKRVNEVLLNKMELGEPDESGRRRPVVIEGSEYKINADLVILAISSSPDKVITSPFNKEPWGTIIVDDNMMTSVDKVFAGGDIVRGPSLVVTSMVDGINAANGIDKLLNK